MEIYHNPRCSSSRKTLQLIENAGKEVTLRRYLDLPPTVEELREILGKLKMTPEELIRKNEAVYKENYKGKNLSDEEWIEAMVLHPRLIQRPIVISGDRAVIGRPPETVQELL